MLLRTTVPSSLRLPTVDIDAVFGAPVVSKAQHVERVFLAVWVCKQIALLGTLWIYARRGAAFARESAAGPVGTGMLLGMLGLGIVWLVQLPFALLGVWWARRNDLTEIGYVDWVFAHWFELGGTFVSICVALLIVMFLARLIGEAWWIPGAAAFVAIAAAFAFVQPYLGETEPLRDPALRRAATDFERKQDVSGIPVGVEDVSGTTSQANAYAVGFGPSRRIVLWSTMVEGTFSDDEVRFVLAHEIAHHSSDHIPKALAWFALLALPGAWLLMRLTRSRGGMGLAATVPYALLVVTVIQLGSTPVQSWISRRMEAEADWKALQTTRDPGGARGLFVGFAETSLTNPDPPTWEYVLLGSHPSLEQRVAMVDAWQRLRQPSP